MISVSLVSARAGLLDGLRLPSSRLRPSPKPIATEGMPIARIREHTTAARPEKRKFLMPKATPAPQRELRGCKDLSDHRGCAAKPRNLSD